MKYELYGYLHRTAKKILKRGVSNDAYRMISIKESDIDGNGNLVMDSCEQGSYINELSPCPKAIKKSQVYPVENIVPREGFEKFRDSFIPKSARNKADLGIKENEALQLWMNFVRNSVIAPGFKNGGLHYAGYILEADEWCLPSWVWTNAALVRMFCKCGATEEAEQLGRLLLSCQENSGGWIVRNDYDSEGAVPVLAPNDSAYIANNCCIELFLTTGNNLYLDSAVKCANWIIETARNDGMVYSGYDVKREHWQTKNNIVDVGFTAGLFARLYEITNDNRYRKFLERFVGRFVTLFYMPDKNGFATSLDSDDKQMGGMFGRGQAWALEGLIPAYRVLKDADVKRVIDSAVENLLKTQDKSGGWPYNISKPLMGIDCKATPIIACALLEWQHYSENKNINNAAEKAFRWCLNHTARAGIAQGGIFSYTTEGAIVHHLYTSTAFVYSSSYAIELYKMLNEN